MIFEQRSSEASIKHSIVELGQLGVRLVWSRGFVTDDGDKVSAIEHSLAAAIAFVMVFVGSSALFSKIKRFLAVQMDHDIHGKSIIYYTNLTQEGRTNN
ncbi:hypothetical protein DY000_02049660 [Brassica cretica]|uniref:Uncharacterized protein n=1 Tax=Brassica cretica TaxID=69181 RepID=A0ABQ7EQS2_BRACR|nr:hypothetical protein DY000_02049660 [Brassica cretica]